MDAVVSVTKSSAYISGSDSYAGVVLVIWDYVNDRIVLLNEDRKSS
jgi:hypothetical protein